MKTTTSKPVALNMTMAHIRHMIFGAMPEEMVGELDFGPEPERVYDDETELDLA